MHRLHLVYVLLACLMPAAGAAGDEKTAPLKGLMVTGGCCHDYDKQKIILTEGISARANVTWTIVHEGGTTTNHKVSIYADPAWAKGFDVVVHNECFSDTTDLPFVQNILRPHEQGLPAVVIHCAMHSYRISTEEWFKFVGVTSLRHGASYAHEVKNLMEAHPVMKGFPPSWMTPNGELYLIEKIQPQAIPLAHSRSKDTGRDEVCVWVSRYGQGRVFGTTLGHHTETVQAPVYLDLVARGLLWATEKLDDQGKPKPGYGPVVP